MGGDNNGSALFSLDDIHLALSSERRRYILYYLREEEAATIDQIARQVIAWGEPRPPENVSETAVERQKIELYHEHLPQLADAKMIEYDDRTDTARYNHPSALLERFVNLCASIESPRE